MSEDKSPTGLELIAPARLRKLEAVLKTAARYFKKHGGRDDLEDYLQTGYVYLLQHAEELAAFETDESAERWLFVVVKHRLQDADGMKNGKWKNKPRLFFRARNRSERDEEYSVPYDEERRGYSSKRDELRALIVETVKKRPGVKKHQRARIVLATLMNYSQAEIARKMGKRLGAVNESLREFVKFAREELATA